MDRKQITISLPEKIVSALDAERKKIGISRSALMTILMTRENSKLVVEE